MEAEDGEKPLLDEWRQSDFAIDDFEMPLWLNDEEGGDLFAAVAVKGLALVSQSCDIIRSEVERPYVQVAALVPVDAKEMDAIKRRRKPRYAAYGALEQHGFAVDLDLVATVDKRVVSRWMRHEGCASSQERTDFSAALARHKERFAFPDEFNKALVPMRRWIERKFEKPNVHGEMLRSIEEIRVCCDDWESPSPELDFVGVLIGEPDATRRLGWADSMKALEATLTPTYPQASLRLATRNELTVEEYKSSVRLDLDGLSDN